MSWVVRPAQKPTASPAKEECAKLTAEFKAAFKEYSARMKEVYATEEYKKAREKSDTAALNKLMSSAPQPDLADFTKRFQEAATKYAGTADAPMFLTWIAQYAPDKAVVHAAVDAMVDKHIDSAEFEAFLEGASMSIRRRYDAASATAVLERIVAKSTKNPARAQALYLQAMLIRDNRNASAEDKAKANKLNDEAAELVKGTPLADAINAPKFEIENLQIGMQAPDIAGEDLNGVPFKLSDYRGKVVVLDFWGDW